MTTSRRRKYTGPTAQESAAEHFAAITVALAEISAAIKLNPESSWGEAGDLCHYREQLEQIADRLAGRGEYA